MSIKKRFNKLKLKEKIQLTSIVFICYILVFVFYEDITDNLFIKKQETTQKIFHKPVTSQDKRLSNLEVYRYLNSAVKKYHIDLLETKISQNKMKVEICGEFKNIISFMNQYEKNFIIDSYEMEKTSDNRITLSLGVDIKTFYEDNNIDKTNFKVINPYLEEVQKNSSKRTISSDIIITAILKSEVLIDEKWYSLDDIYEDFRIKEIRKRSVIFVNIKTEEEKIIRIINE